MEKVFRNEGVESRENSWIEAPSMAAIGWIPYYRSSEALGNVPMRKCHQESQATRLLFASGNPEPQSEFSGDIRFIDRLGLRDFRAAVAVRSPRLVISEKREPVALRVAELHQVGPTPVPFFRGHLDIGMAGRDQVPRSGRLLPTV